LKIKFLYYDQGDGFKNNFTNNVHFSFHRGLFKEHFGIKNTLFGTKMGDRITTT